MTTVVNTHDMNSVMEIGDYILYMYQGRKEWEGSKKISYSAKPAAKRIYFRFRIPAGCQRHADAGRNR